MPDQPTPDRPAAERPVRPPIRLQVVRTERRTPHLVRVVLGGPGFAAFTDNGFTDRYVKLRFPRPGVAYEQPFDLDAAMALPPEQRPVTRTYTVSDHDPELGQLSIDFVVHGDEGVAGPWAASAQPGDELVLAGPGGAYRPDPEVAWHLVAGDEAALPAIEAALAAMPEGVLVHAFVEVDGDADHLPLPSPAEVHLHWIHRDRAAPAPDGVDRPSALAAAVRALDFPPGPVQCFVHGELGMVRDLKPFLAQERQVPRELLSVSGYWRRGKDEDGFQLEKRTDPQT